MTTRLSPPVGKLLYGLLFAVVLPVLLVLWARGAAGAVTLPPLRSVPAGVALFACGLGLILLGMRALWVWGGGLPMNAFPPPQLVTRSVYRVMPHPIYAGFTILCAGASLATGSAAGLWLVTPVVALGCAALVLGHERIDLEERFGKAGCPPTLLRLPAADLDAPEAADRVSAWLLVLLPWLLLYEAVQAIGIPPGAVDAFLPFEKGWPVLEANELVYASTYAFVFLAPAVAATKGGLRRFAIRGWVGTALVTLLFLCVPLVAPPRPFVPTSALGELLAFERRWDSAAGSFPSFHVIWAFLAAPLWASRWPRRAAAFWGLAALIAASCVTTGMHALVDVLAGALVASLLFRVEDVWNGLRRLAERAAGSWREWDLGPVRVLNHGAWAGGGVVVGLLLVFAFAGEGRVGSVLLVATCSLVLAALWAQVIEGSPALLRPYGYYGGLLGIIVGSAAAALFGTSPWLMLAAFAVAGPWIQSAGRVRCLVQGCCHGRPAPEGVGIRYRHPRSRVCRLSDFRDVPIHPTPLYSILWNAVVALAVLRLWAVHAPLTFIAGAYLILTGLGRFVEEAYRGEPQTPVAAGLRLYQWVAAGTVVLGAVFTTIGAVPAPSPRLGAEGALAAIGFGLLTAAALGVDFPRSNRRFARLI
jgi:prolipoprotein diacylglyceryltransferase/membrane-associated phospholipid phosphatase/protein-S-isoprenylcysteine O-methyltransferase Ste14